MKGEQTLAHVAHVYQVHPTTLKIWKDRFLQLGAEIFERDPLNQREETSIGESPSTPNSEESAFGNRERLREKQSKALSALLRRQAE